MSALASDWLAGLAGRMAAGLEASSLTVEGEGPGDATTPFVSSDGFSTACLIIVVEPEPPGQTKQQHSVGVAVE